MSDLIREAAGSPFIAVAAGFAVLLLVYFLFKGLVKLILILLIIALAVGGYFYFREAPNGKGGLRETVESARSETKKALEKGEEVAKKGQEALSKGRRILERGKEFLQKGAAAAKEMWDRAREAAGRVERLFRREEGSQ